MKSFRKVFVSSEIDVPLERIMFFDDTRSNVEAALALGMPAVHVRSLDDVKKSIAAL
jgi:putative hydrolase of the HAD superfamily